MVVAEGPFFFRALLKSRRRLRLLGGYGGDDREAEEAPLLGATEEDERVVPALVASRPRLSQCTVHEWRAVRAGARRGGDVSGVGRAAEASPVAGPGGA